jgi:hypothetical protein
MTDDETRVQAVVDGLGYDFRQFTVPHFIQHLEAFRARDIILHGVPFDQGLHGFWVRADTADYVFFNRRTHQVHQVHHILHEVGHIVLGHPLQDVADFLSPALAAQLRATLSVPLCGHCRRWEPCNTPEEREAEWFVRHLQRKIMFAGRLDALTHPDTSIGALSHFTRSLGLS